MSEKGHCVEVLCSVVMEPRPECWCWGEDRFVLGDPGGWTLKGVSASSVMQNQLCDLQMQVTVYIACKFLSASVMMHSGTYSLKQCGF